MTEVEETAVQEQLAMAEDVQRQRQELEAIEGEMRGDVRNLEQVREQVCNYERALQEHEKVLLRRTEAAREEARQQEQETRERFERREQQMADREAEMAEHNEQLRQQLRRIEGDIRPQGRG